MSVYILEYGHEEFPEMAAACRRTFDAIAQNPTQSISATPLSTTPPSHISQIYREAGYEQDGAALSLLKATREFLLVAIMPPTATASSNNNQYTPIPLPTHITMEDDGQSVGAERTSAYAAKALANLDEPKMACEA